MIDFILAALPWVVFGITIAVVLTNFSKRNKSRSTTESQGDSEDTNTVLKKEKAEEEDYMSIGMSLGICFGVAIGSAFMEEFGTSALTYGICFGMLGGMVVGMNIKKK
ncbi:hypothetical protein [Clostridium sardiniense]|uniref:hypothetical protein n=1 Tax=Clostridium sardiniense TaxID=29369 RepID=UPI003D325EED